MNIAIYPRKSKYSDKSDSISNQIESCREFIGRYYGDEHTILVYDGDEGFSGGNTFRPGYQKMLQDIKSGNINMVVCYMIDRISRNISDFCNFYTVLQEKNCRFVSVKEQIDDSTAMGRAMLYICQVFANLERDNITERITDNLGYLASEGYWFAGTPPYGYKMKKIMVNGKQHSTIEKDPDTIDFYYMLVNMFLSGKSICGMQTYFKQNSIRTPKGSFLSTATMHSILSNPIYASNDTAVYNYFISKGSNIPYSREEFDGKHGITVGGRKRTKNGCGTKPDQWTIYIGKHEPLISGKQWVAIQKRFESNLMFKTRKHDVGLLRGVLKCKCCGNNMSVSARTLKDTGNIGGHYYCNTHKRKGNSYCKMGQVTISRVDAEIIKFIKSVAEDKTVLEQFQMPEPKNNNMESEILYIEKSIKSTKDKIDNIMELMAESGAAAKYMLAKVDDLDKQLEELEAKRASLIMELASREVEEKSTGNIFENCKKFIQDFDKTTYSEKNKLIKLIFRVLYIDMDGKIQIGRENLYI